MNDLVSTVGAVVVHHNSLATVVGTLDCLRRSGLQASQICVVDNSMDQEVRSELSRTVGDGARIVYTANRGYAAAVNLGAKTLTESEPSVSYLLVCTHECRFEPQAIPLLIHALRSDHRLGVVGPLVTVEGGDTVWSAGGYVTRYLRLPRHRRHGDRSSDFVASAGTHIVDWLDGCFLLYRAEVLVALPMDERFFLYMEEADHHVTLSRSGVLVGVVQSAEVVQSTSGQPDYYLGRGAWCTDR